jgi:hypothetical protein
VSKPSYAPQANPTYKRNSPLHWAIKLFMFVIMPKPSCAASFAEAKIIEMLKERKKPKKLRRSKILKITKKLKR